MIKNSFAHRWQAHKTLLVLAVPMILANITTPLLGLVDTAVMGHMDSPAMLAGASIGALVLTQIYWVCGFLRMSTTGLSAQAKGHSDSRTASARVLYQAVVLSFIPGLLLLLLHAPVLDIGLTLASPSPEVATHTEAYFSVRVWSAPAALMNLALIGWLVGQQRTRAVLIIQVVGNLLNAGLDILFVVSYDMSVAGVALASVFAEYTMALLSFGYALSLCKGIMPRRDWFDAAARKLLLTLNTNMLLRNLALQLCLAFLTFQGARLGETQAAINAILMQFFVLIALGLDGVAYAVEALVGEAAGRRNRRNVIRSTTLGLLWSSLFALVYASGFYVFGDKIILMLTDIPKLQEAAMAYLPLMVLLPLVGHWCFLFDGVFVGLTRSGTMRDSMILSALLVYFPVWWLTKENGNEALWYALLSFLLARGATLGGGFWWLICRNGLLFASPRAGGKNGV